ncbi:MAG: hypothetical protein ABUS47_13050 [Steroidobacter sp.]
MNALQLTITVAATGLAAYFGAYLRAMGTQRAQTETIGKITQIQETIKHQNSEILERLKAKEQLRLAAIDKRLEAHQLAFRFWHAMVTAKNDTAAIIEASNFWNQNCLYLEASVRSAFIDALNLARTREAAMRDTPDEFQTSLMAFPKILFDAIQLPPLSPSEQRFLEAKSPHQ